MPDKPVCKPFVYEFALGCALLHSPHLVRQVPAARSRFRSHVHEAVILHAANNRQPTGDTPFVLMATRGQTTCRQLVSGAQPTRCCKH